MKVKRFISAFIVLILLVSIIPNSAFAESSVIEGTFNYMPAFEDMATEPFTYSDSWFSKSGTADNAGLLGMSCNLALSTFEVRNCTYVTELYEKIGFGNISVEDMVEKTSRDSIGTAIACKKVGEQNVIAVAIRGEKYDCEWASNFIVGKSGNAKGFNDASIKVIERLKDYINKNELKNNKIWIAGYSRAGSIADLTGVYINNNLSEFNTKEDDLYIYAFEPPAACLDDTVYQNINIVINKDDLVPYVYPKSWGFHTNGKITDISTNNTITTYINLTSPEEYQNTDLSEFLEDTFDWLSLRLSREEYAENLEEPVSNLLEIFFSKSDEDRTKILNFLKDDIASLVLNDPEIKGKLIMPVWSAMSHNSDFIYQSIADVIIEFLESVRNAENAKALTDAEYQTLLNSIYPIIRTLGPVVVDDMNYYVGVDYDEYYENFVPDYYVDDYDLGAKYGAELGSWIAYDAGFYGEEFDNTPQYDDGSYGSEYTKGYNDAYIKAYNENYEIGAFHAENLDERGKYDGTREGAESGFSTGKDGEERTPYNEYFWEEDWMTEEYIEAYNEAYEKAYNISYDEGLLDTNEEVPFPEILDSYHIISLAKNITDILKNHYGQNTLKLVKEWVSNHPSDSDSGAIIEEKAEQKPENGGQVKNEEKLSPKTGDMGIYFIYIILIMIISLSVALISYKKLVKKNF